MISAENSNSISVLVRTFNSEKTLPRLLNALDFQAGDEIVVVDSGSTDRTLAVAEKYGARIFHAPAPFNYSKSLNIGFREAQNPWVLVISSHTVPIVPNLLGIFRTASQRFPENVAVGYGPNTLSGRTDLDEGPDTFFSDCIPAGYELLCGNGNALYRASIWQTIPFCETIRTAEDKAWMDEIFRNHFRVAFIPAARTLNQSRYPLRYMFMKGYSDRRAGSSKPMNLWELLLALGSLAKRFVVERMPIGNWARYSAHIVGQFFGSFGLRDNTPYRSK